MYMLLILLLSIRINSQVVYQQTVLELNDMLEDEKSYLCQATTAIELQPGFSYNPILKNEMSLGIDRYSVFPPSDGVYGGNVNREQCVVGTIPGILDVSAMGAAVYSIDIQLPQALRSMTPKLSIAYNSQSANGLLGWAWDLLGVSSIERVGQTEYHDGKVTSVDFINDRYVVDGQRLMSVGSGEYKTEVDNFDKIVSYNGTKKSPDYFVVFKSDGTIWEYGTTESSKVEPQGRKDVVLKWLVSKITDRDGNAIIYNYYEDNARGESYIKSIEYTSNEKADVKPAYSVVFKYNESVDSSEGYVCGSKVSNTKILKEIGVCNNYSGRKIIEYSFVYNEPGKYDKKYYIHYRLNSIQLTIDGKKINPTRIIWNSKDKWATENDCGFVKYELDKTLFNKVSFIGDFNGDGVSDVLLLPYKIQDTYATDVVGEIYLNNGDGSFSSKAYTKIGFSKNLDWVYVCDINGDGVDDMVPFENHYDDMGALEKAKFSLLQMSSGRLLNKGTYTFDKSVSLIPANYVEKDKCGFLLIDVYNGKKNKDLAKFIYLKNENVVCEEIRNSNVINGKNIDCVALDITGDGISELLTLDDDGYNVYSIKNATSLNLECCCSGNAFTKKIYPFPNDYNGDGKVDLLYYDPANYWNISMSTGIGFSDPVSCVGNNLLKNVSLNAKDKYRYSLKEMEKPSVTIRTTDFDGDGTADVGVFNNYAGNYYLEIGFSPYKDVNASSYSFRFYNRYYIPVNYSHQTILLGRFLPHENVSILSVLPRVAPGASKAYIVSFCPNSAYYSVESIVDGMSNSTELSYDYLVKGNDDFYTCTGDVSYYKVSKKSVPILALREQKTYNVNEKAVVKKYNYHNALVHKKGHGFLGFERVDVRNYVDGKLVSRQMQGYSMEPLGSYCIPVLMYNNLFHGENQLIKSCYFEYEKFVCARNSKVISLLLSREVELAYDVDRRGVVIKNVVAKNTYETDISSDMYYDRIVQLKKSQKGYDKVEADAPETCCYHEEVDMTYGNVIDNWIVNRPIKIVKSTVSDGNDAVGEAQIIEYDRANPMRVVKETMIPNVKADAKDSLTLFVKYKYDIVGNVVEYAISSPSLKKEKVIKSEYGANYKYRYKTKTIDEIGREIVCKYDQDFGILNSTVDYNDHITRIEKEPFGVKSVVTMSDGMVNTSVLRWSANNEYAPANSSYYCWEKSTGKSESMVFYHKSGAELRRVAFDIDGKAVIVDKIYDDYGNIKQESYPYYEDEDKLFVSNVYDSYNRIVEVQYPNASYISYTYDGNNVQTEHVAFDAKKSCKKESYNVMGWLTTVVDNGGNVVKYEYYSDGLLKSTQLGENGNSRISIVYDNRRNRASIYDPNHGQMSYKYDALGNLVKISNSQYVVEMEYDVLGRMLQRKENDLRRNTKRLVRWEYSCDKGYDGMLRSVTSTGGHQLEYVYDDKLRLLYTIEQIMGKKYKTTYSYDEANRVSSISYPSGFSVLKKYSNSGYEKMICDAGTEEVLWKTDKTNSKGYVTEYTLGNGLKSQYSYNRYDGMLEKIFTKRGGAIIQDLLYGYDGMGNLMFRYDRYDNNCEEFKYDSYDRLTDVVLNGKTMCRMGYDKNGNIRNKEVNGVDVLYNTIYAQNKPNAIASGRSDCEKVYERFNQSVGYSTYDNVVDVNSDDKSLLINYGYDNDRIFMQYKVGDNVKKKTYVGNCEYIEENGTVKILTYLEGPMGVFAVHVKGADETINYIHKDNLQSWNVITDDNGKVLQKLSFDAWGNIRDAYEWDKETEEQALFDRGFTGHEHLWDFGMINMNGRLYDPLLSMMLSPDNNIQQPKSSQNFNRYSYCLNNPLKYYDPTGEWVESLALGIAGGAANVVLNARDIDSFGEAAMLFGVGFVKGFLMEFTMGQSWFLQVGVGALTEGALYGVNRMVNIGDGNFDFNGDDWNSVKSASHYGLGSGLVKSFMFSYIVEPTDEQYGVNFFEMSYYREYSYGLTSLAAHGMGCWFSGQPFLTSMSFKDVGFDLKMLGIIAKRMMASYLHEIGFDEKALKKRAQEIKDSILDEVLVEMPDHPDFEYEYYLSGVFIEDSRIYVVGNVYQMIPGEMLEIYPIPFFEEVITFPFTYSLFKTLFFNK